MVRGELSATQLYGKRPAASKPPPTFGASSKLKETLILSVDLSTITEKSLEEARRLTSKSLGRPCTFHLVKAECMDNVKLRIFIAVEALGSMIGVYEVMPYCGSVRCNRVCDRVVSDLLALHGSFPGISCKLNPIEGNTFAGSPILPSGASPDLIVGFCC